MRHIHLMRFVAIAALCVAGSQARAQEKYIQEATPADRKSVV